MWIYLLLLPLLPRVWSFRLVSIQIPEKAYEGSGVCLRCVYDLEGEKLYNIKWSLDEVEFFRFVPSDKQTKLFFPVKGIQVDIERSGNESVFIQTNTSGRYRCEISADAPSFHTLTAERMMAVEGYKELSDSDTSTAIVISSPCLLVTVILWCLEVYSIFKWPVNSPKFKNQT